jgi:hypothetical protein
MSEDHIALLRYPIGTKRLPSLFSLHRTVATREGIGAAAPAQWRSQSISKTEGARRSYTSSSSASEAARNHRQTSTVGVKTFPRTISAQPLHPARFCNWFRELCNQAELFDVWPTVYGKARPTLAEIGGSANQIATLVTLRLAKCS